MNDNLDSLPESVPQFDHLQQRKKKKRKILAINKSNNPIVKKENKDATPSWLYMMVNFLHNQKINTWIDNSENPIDAVRKHNEKKINNAKSTKSAAPFWKLTLIIGPFFDDEERNELQKLWNTKSRGIIPRRNKGVELAKKNNKECFSSNIPFIKTE